MTIHQVQLTYVMEHDRILVRLNTHAGEELRLWLTRRMVRNLFPHIMEATDELIAEQITDGSHDGGDNSALAQFKKQESLLKADFSTPFNSQAAALPIGDAPLLATALHITPLEDRRLRIVFEENLPGAAATRSFEVTLGPELLHGFLHLLESALQNSDWGIGRQQGERSKAASEADILAAAEPGRYLN